MIPTPDLGLFSVEPTAAQLSFRHLPAGDVSVEVDGAEERRLDHDGGPRVIEIAGLTPDRTVGVSVIDSTRTVHRFSVTTPPDLPGEELYRFATISDVHLGGDDFGIHRTVSEPGANHVTTAAAVKELLAWGAQLLIVKGDLVNVPRPGTWRMAAQILGDLPVPVVIIPGNHDVSSHGTISSFEAARRVGLELRDGTSVIDVPGLRLVLFDSTHHGRIHGTWSRSTSDVCDAVGDSDDPAMVLTHHHPMPRPVPTFLPIGIPSPEALRFARAVRRVDHRVWGTSGHTHRYRRLSLDGLTWTETGSPKDFPGGWAGYVVHEAGVRQVVRRVVDPGRLPWLDRTSRAAGGSWGRWSPGRLEDRCLTVRWN